MKRKVQLTIIGAGSAGLSAARAAKKNGLDFILVDKGPLGTTCARVGCMPSKALINIANSFNARKTFAEKGISGAELLTCDIPAAMRHVRKLRDRFTEGMVAATKELAGERLIIGRAKILGRNIVEVGDDIFETEKVIIATGATPKYPSSWRENFSDRILTSENFFEQEDLPKRIAVIGLGTIGLEIGQALSRLGLEVTGFGSGQFIGGISDPEVNSSMCSIVKSEFPIHLGSHAEIEGEGEALRVSSDGFSVVVDKVLVAAGVTPNLDGLGMENLGVEPGENGIPEFNGRSMQIVDLPVFIAGDADGYLQILHEALDEGFIAGSNAAGAAPEQFCRRTPLHITFTDPEIFSAGRKVGELKNLDYVVGSVDFSNQARALIEGSNRGLLRIYVERATGILVGAEGACPAGEHFAHQLAWSIQHDAKVSDLLQCPFYHPVLEEALRAALKDAAKQLPKKIRMPELSLCQSSPESPIS